MALNLPKLPYNIPLVELTLVPTKSTQQWWQVFADNIKTSVDGLSDAVADIQTLQSQMADRITEIAGLQSQMLDRIAEIEAAQATADTARLNDSISASATAPTNILTASDAGTDATITITNHDRLYGDGTILTITGSVLTGLAYSTEYAIYYDDPTRTVTAPTFQATTTLKDAQYNKMSGRHFCGQVTTPAAGGGSSSGGPGAPGGGGPYP